MELLVDLVVRRSRGGRPENKGIANELSYLSSRRKEVK
jgi:hypothetical protein